MVEIGEISIKFQSTVTPEEMADVLVRISNTIQSHTSVWVKHSDAPNVVLAETQGARVRAFLIDPEDV